jgi:UDP-N-acetylglucosamine--N-acetylmuramyl-(pentapeptide) pyrophosphoryl-undecaprenol N-acetylglucosamine transferase
VAEALRERGVTVTFAGTRDRVESRLVPEAGFELDTFPVSGFPRELSPKVFKAIWNALRAPFACLGILGRRRPDVVLGGGGYVAGPMVLAARLRRIPAVLTEADAHLGLANRLAAPLARKVFLAYAIPGREGARYEVVGRPIPRAHLGASREDGRDSGCRSIGPSSRSLVRSQVRVRSTSWRWRRGARVDPRFCT